MGCFPRFRVFGNKCGLIKYVSVASTKVTVSYGRHDPLSLCSKYLINCLLNGGFPVRKLLG
jgi:hypothetical protein